MKCLSVPIVVAQIFIQSILLTLFISVSFFQIKFHLKGCTFLTINCLLVHIQYNFFVLFLVIPVREVICLLHQPSA